MSASGRPAGATMGEDKAGPVSWARLQKLAQVPFKKLQGADRGFQVIIS